jgi:hypothetical protein
MGWGGRVGTGPRPPRQSRRHVAVALLGGLALAAGTSAALSPPARADGPTAGPPATRPAVGPAAAASPAASPATMAAGPTGDPVGGVAFSGMTKVADGQWVVVHDWKASERREPVGVIEFAERTAGAKPTYRPLPLANAPFPPNDLEAVCPLPGAPAGGPVELLAVEGGGVSGDAQRPDKKRRLWRLRLRPMAGVPDRLAGVEVVGSPIPLPPEVPADEEAEGLVCLPAGGDGRCRLLLGLRPGNRKQPPGPGQIWLTTYDPAAGTLASTGEKPFVLAPPPHVARPGVLFRGCADLLLVPAAGGPGGGSGGGVADLLAVSTEDPGDAGPWRSVIYRAATVAADGTLGKPTAPAVVAVIDGLKVEALAAGVVTVAGDPGKTPMVCPLTIATDDEDFGGVWRPLFPAPPATAPAAP